MSKDKAVTGSKKRRSFTMTEYAMYKGDYFIDLGTLDYLAEKYHKRQKSLKFLATPTVHKRSTNKSLMLYRIED